MKRLWKRFNRWLTVKANGEQSYIPWKCTFCGAKGRSCEKSDKFSGDYYHKARADKALKQPVQCFFCLNHSVYPETHKLYYGEYDPRFRRELHVYMEKD